MLIPKNIFPIAKLCDTESTRYALGGVRLEREGEHNTPVAVATDGRRLVAARWDETPGEEYPDSETGNTTHVPDFETIVPCKEWNEAAKLAPRKHYNEAMLNVLVEETTANGRMRLAGSDFETVRAIEPRTLEGRFPQWRDAVPDYKGYEIRLATRAQAHDLAEWIRNRYRRLLAKDETQHSDNNEGRVRVEVISNDLPLPQWHVVFQGVIEAGFEVTYFGPEQTDITVAPTYLAEILTVIEKMTATPESRGVDLVVPLDPSKPVLVKGKGNGTEATGVLMPLARDK